MRSQKLKNIRYLLLLFVLIIAGGTAGYMIIEDYSFIDSLFFTIISITTVGYGTLTELSYTGKIFTIILLISSFITIGFIVENITRYITDGEFTRIIKRRKTKKIMDKITNHIIVCGYGAVGKHAVSELLTTDQSIVVIDNDENLDEYDLQEEKIILIRGDARKEEVLQKARIDKAKVLITTLNSDADNVFVVITAKELNPNLKIISRAVEDSTDHKLRIAGADHVILPDSVGGVRMAKLAVQPDVIEFLENILAKSGITVNLAEINCEHLKKEHIGKTINDLNIRKLSGANVIGFKTKEGEFIFNPSADTELLEGSKLFLLGTPEQIEKFKKIILNS